MPLAVHRGFSLISFTYVFAV